MSIAIDQLRKHFFDVSHWVSPEATCDALIYGEPDRKVKKIGTGWTPCSQNLEAAAKDGCDLFISHEVFYYGNWAPGVDSTETPWGRRRMNILKKYNMACMNQHDTWDNFPEYGIRDSWRAFLGLTDLLAERAYYNPAANRFAPQNSLTLNKIPPQSLGGFALNVAKKCSIFPSSHGVTLHGDQDREIKTVAVGVGCHIPTLEMLELGADALVLTLDRAFQTTIRIPLLEMNANLIVVEHGTAEMPGMLSMAEYLNKTLEGVEAKFYCEEPAAKTIVP